MDRPVGGDDPALRAGAAHGVLARLGRRAELELDVDRRRLRARQQLVLQHRPVGGVVDVVGDVELGAAKVPRPRRGILRRSRMAQPRLDLAPGGRRAVDLQLLRRRTGSAAGSPDRGGPTAPRPRPGRRRTSPPWCAAAPTCARCALQNVATVAVSPKRGKRVTASRVRRTTHSAASPRPASTTSASATSCSQRASASRRTRPLGAASASPTVRECSKRRPTPGMGDELVEVGGGDAHAPPSYRARTSASDPVPGQTRSLPAKRATICRRVQDARGLREHHGDGVGRATAQAQARALGHGPAAHARRELHAQRPDRGSGDASADGDACGRRATAAPWSPTGRGAASPR